MPELKHIRERTQRPHYMVQIECNIVKTSSCTSATEMRHIQPKWSTTCFTIQEIKKDGKNINLETRTSTLSWFVHKNIQPNQAQGDQRLLTIIHMLGGKYVESIPHVQAISTKLPPGHVAFATACPITKSFLPTKYCFYLVSKFIKKLDG